MTLHSSSWVYWLAYIDLTDSLISTLLLELSTTVLPPLQIQIATLRRFKAGYILIYSVFS